MKSLISSISVCLLLAGFAAGCSSAPKQEAAVEDKSGEYVRMKKSIENSKRIAPGYRLKIRHSSDDKITGEYSVDFHGKIKLPYKVSIVAAGQTPKQLSQRISRALKKFFKGESTIKVDIIERSYMIEVRGDVRRPGRYSVRIDTKLEEVVAKAGGFSETGSASEDSSGSSVRPEYLRIERPNFSSSKAQKDIAWFQLAQYFYSYKTEPEFLWHGGEGLVFQQTAPSTAKINSKWSTITVMGAVREPKEHPVLVDVDLLTYLTRSGGPSDTADLNKIEVIHRGTDSRETLDISSASNFKELLPGDVIVVHSTDDSPNTLQTVLTFSQIMSGIAMVFLVFL